MLLVCSVYLFVSLVCFFPSFDVSPIVSYLLYPHSCHIICFVEFFLPIPPFFYDCQSIVKGGVCDRCAIVPTGLVFASVCALCARAPSLGTHRPHCVERHQSRSTAIGRSLNRLHARYGCLGLASWHLCALCNLCCVPLRPPARPCGLCNASYC